MRRTCELVALVLGAGCGSSTMDLTGMYRVDSHVASMSPCTTDTLVANPTAFLRFVSSTNGYELQACGSLEPTTCSGIGAFIEPIDDDGWRRHVEKNTPMSQQGMCELKQIDGTAYLDNETALTVEVTTYTQQFVDASPQCTAPTRDDYDGLPCTLHELLAATQLTNP
jgi:hypothetical protein